MKKLLALLFASLFVIMSFTSCGKEPPTEENEVGEEATEVPKGVTTLSFSKANSVEEMEKIDGGKVEIIGYMSTLSPITGSFMYLMNLPYQSCPFCVPNTTQLSNTIAVYAKDGSSFEFTDRAIKVEGIMEFGNYVDEYGYEYSYRIKDATYKVIDTSELGDKMLLWQQLAETDVINEVYNMYEYVNFLCFWPSYTVEFSNGKDYLYPADALMFIEEEGAQYNYGAKEGYFDNMIKTIKEVNETEFDVLVQNIEKAKALSEKALAALKNNEYEVIPEYSTVFKDGRNQYKMKDYLTYEKEMQQIYKEFAQWLSEWEI